MKYTHVVKFDENLVIETLNCLHTNVMLMPTIECAKRIYLIRKILKYF